ncbi:MAG TPA: PAS domain-containing protein [Noviherbaspirillum sp.]|uniref:hybrid sensor histidine kinase/response regulator n=1 Tax=Noviherbaspirillum sp. TaxID=1926288 RepID=UPI002B467156|nr:PAS domain-containing protein [Noviherbaspirillum sp.]HJV86047.1 PAS domain-containing protein [Noviherbaspirillum sp.]
MAVSTDQVVTILGNEQHLFTGPTDPSSNAMRTPPSNDGPERNEEQNRQVTGMLHEQDRYLRLITETAPVMIAYFDAEERFRFANNAYSAWFGQPSGDILGKTLNQVLGPLYPQAYPYITRALAGEQVTYEITVHNMLGERHVMTTYAPDIDPDGSVRGFSAMATDITERRNTEQALREREKQLRLITDAFPVLIAQCDAQYRLSFINKAYTTRFGHRPENMIGKRIPDLVGEELFASIRQYIDAALCGTPQEHEARVRLPENDERYLHMMFTPELNEHGEVRGLFAAVSDTTQLREAEEQLHRREREFKTLVENSPDIISRIDRNMRHIYVNPAIEKLAGIAPEAYLGKTKAELGLPTSVVQAWDNAARAAFETGAEQRLDFDHVIAGQMRYFSGRIIPETDRYGHVESVIGIAYDVTERARMEKERDELLARERTARIQAETAARARDEFLAIVSHELRAPLNGIQSWAHVLENYVKDIASAPLAQRALQGIKTGVGQQVRLIEDLLDVTRMMSGKLRLVKQPLALLPTLQAAVESVRAMAASKHISVSCTYRITSEQVEGDADRVQQIFWNLLSNAVKFTPDGGNVWLSAAQRDGEICVTVRDDGIGVSPDFLPHLFNRFSQEDTSSTRDHSGLGLGLFLVRHLVELHGGRVVAESEGEGKGSTFRVYFPLRVRSDKYLTIGPVDDGVASSVPLPSLNGVHILLIDDQEEARESLTVVLTDAGASVHAASSAREAIDWLCTLSRSEFPDVFVCDIAMPGEDGYSVLRKIRAWKTAGGDTPLQRMPALALTAFAQREDRIKALTAGFQMHVTKPVAPEELIVVIDAMAARP